MNQKLKFLIEREEIFLERGENAGYHHFLFLSQCFKKVPFKGMLKFSIMW